MAEEKKASCVEASTGLITPDDEKAEADVPSQGKPREEKRMQASVGKEAPDFELTAYHEGGFKNVRLSEFRDKWVLLCFYPGDFTFV